ncbi:CBS domain-containing protein [Verrucomicrobia bacterium S94]|nr:CBS domain-containing protein [Verrucomicrobia bacterium S94]
MNIMNYTRGEESWQPALRSAPRDAVFETMLNRLCSNGFYDVNATLTPEAVLKAVIARENRQTTALGDGIAFPHARLEHLHQALFAVATFEEPVMFEQAPVRIVCLILTPQVDPSVSLKIMAQLSRLLTDPPVRRAVLNAKSPTELRDIFLAHNPRIDKPILARDIMRPPRFSLKESDPVSVCSHLMSVNHQHAIPVVDKEQRILGEITVERLFKYGLPEFFGQLKSVSFIAEFDPFEKYFEDEQAASAADMMSPTVKTVPMDYTIMEIVFDLAIKSYPKLYVVDENNRWVGSIDKGLVLDTVINH